MLLLFDAQGKQLQSIKIEKGLNETSINLANYASGNYVIALSIDGYNGGVKKIIVQW